MEETMQIKRSVAIEMIRGTAPKSSELLALAEQEPSKPQYISASYYAPVVQELRNKGFSWTDVHSWFESRGIFFSQQAFISGWRNWMQGSAIETE